MIDFTGEHCLVQSLKDVDPGVIRFNFNGITNYSEQGAPVTHVLITKEPIPFEAYQLQFNQVMHHLQTGNTYLLNLTCPTRIQPNAGVEEIFLSATAKYKFYWRDKFLFFSPEPFISIQNGIITTFPMKGTAEPNCDGQVENLMTDPKEIAEQYTVVDLLRNDLSQVATNVHVEKFRFQEIIQTNQGELLQTSSEIQGTMAADYHHTLGDILFTLLPAGSVTGAPKQKTVEIIQSVEQYSRGFYTGVAGIFDGKNLDSTVIIRYIEHAGNQLIFKSGGGITINSRAESEYAEMLRKVYVPVI
ncbi:MAG: aminodeoxychorismate synthase component I [Ignavibacteria bacterium]|nr:aminodeoxychorismate synthase component I [Ignavibacteria bacterium]